MRKFRIDRPTETTLQALFNDGNDNDNDGCDNNCNQSGCGDALVNGANEQCDDGNIDNSDECLVGCIAARCGDSFVHVGVEECDDGNLNLLDGCDSSCLIEVGWFDAGGGNLQGVCHDSRRVSAEFCDDGDVSSLGCPNCDAAA